MESVSFVMNVIYICYCRSKLLELCQIFSRLVTWPYIISFSVMLTKREHIRFPTFISRSALLLASDSVFILFPTVLIISLDQ
jgi:ABC-type enterochelin transport system permease subunit